MSDKLPDRPPRDPWTIIAKLILPPIVGGSVLSQLPIKWVQQHISIYFFFALAWPFYWIVRKLWAILEPTWLAILAQRVDSLVRGFINRFISRYRQKYLDHVVRECHNFDVKGLSTQGTYALGLQHVFVELLISPELPPGRGSIFSPSEKSPPGSDIWPYLRSGSSPTLANLVIIGGPGSGKTTLLRHIALVLAQRKERRACHAKRKLPILLALRNHASDIKENPDLPLTSVIERSKLFREMGERIPIAWFEGHLKRGQCIVLFDGLDEVADPDVRTSVEVWLERQMRTYGRNRFVVTSRPRASLGRIAGAHRLIIEPFSWDQIKRFVGNWYVANMLAGLRRNDPDIRAEARRDASELLERISSSEVLKELAVNPLLLTMIATIHRFRGRLPERRVELYREIWEVFLSRRDDSPLVPGLTPSQKRCVLEPLAYSMMAERTQEIEAAQAHQITKDILDRVSPGGDPANFLKRIEEDSGLLLKKENGKYEFAHKTFQEYLAAVDCCKRSENLAERVGDDWWHGAVRLYIAQSDGTLVCAACLDKVRNGTATPGVVGLAKACLNEAQQLDPQIREALESVLAELPDSPVPIPVPIVFAPIPPPALKFKLASAGIAVIMVVLTAFIWDKHLHTPPARSPQPPPYYPKINAVFLQSGDMQTMADMEAGCYKSLIKNTDIIGDVSYQRAGPLGLGQESENQWKIPLDAIETKLFSFPKDDKNYIIAIGTPASMRAKERFGPVLHKYNLIGIGLTDPLASGLITQATSRNDTFNIGIVAFLQHPEDFAGKIKDILPGYILHYVYESGYPQNDQMAAALHNTPKMKSVLITSVSHKLTLADFPRVDEVYFSWYPFEQMSVHNDVLKNRIFVATRQEDVEGDGLAAVGVSPDTAALGEQGADLLIKDFKREQQLAQADMRFPKKLQYWINCQSANRLHLSFSKEIIENADRRFGCEAMSNLNRVNSIP